jgi:hypothetical protein
MQTILVVIPYIDIARYYDVCQTLSSAAAEAVWNTEPDCTRNRLVRAERSMPNAVKDKGRYLSQQGRQKLHP